MNCAALFFTLVAAGLMGCALAQTELDDSAPLFDEELKAGTENTAEQHCVPTKTCGSDEEYRCCGPCYQLACRGSVIACESRCYADCYCVKGFVREYAGGPCIPTMFCPVVGLPILSDYEDSDY